MTHDVVPRTAVFSFLRPQRTAQIVMLLILPIAMLVARSVYAAADVGYKGQSTSGASSSPTGEKPESKLWWNDGFWWASMWDFASGDYHIFKLNLATNTWIDTGVTLDTRSNSRADTLWDGNKLYVASHVFSTSTGPTSSGNAAKLWRFSYNSATDQYTLDSGFPEVINSAKTETLVIDKDSTGRLWATWVQQTTSNSRVYKVFVNRTTVGDTNWGTPFELPDSGATVNSDDISSLVAFVDRSGSTEVPKIGVMWSNQQTNPYRFYFASRDDRAADTSWTTVVARAGNNIADDHVSLRSLSADDAGNIFAALKTSIDGSSTSSEQIFVLARRLDGSWSYAMASSGAENQTRPILLIDRTNRQVFVFSSTESGGSVYYKQSSVVNLSFAPGLGTTFIQDGSSAELNNATSTKQTVSCESGIVVLASNDTTRYYWHNYLPLPGCSTAPTATQIATQTATPPTPTATQIATQTATPPTPTAMATVMPTATPTSSIPSAGFTSVDIGSGTTPGTTAQNGTQYTVRGSGVDIWGRADGFRYVYQQSSGDMTFVAQITQWIGGGNSWAKGGLMIRNSVDVGAANCMIMLTGGKGIGFQVRSSDGATTSNVIGPTSFSVPVWLKLVKLGNTCSGYYSTDGATWTQVGTSQTLGFASSYLSGLAVTSHDNTRFAEQSFDNISVSN